MDGKIEWQARGKWEAFYNGSFAPHLIPAERTAVRGNKRLAAERLPWRAPGKPASALVRFWDSAEGKALQEAAARGERITAVEPGCGTGENMAALLDAPLGFSLVVGVDIVDGALRVAREGPLRAKSQSRYRLVRADILAGGAASRLEGAPFDFCFDSQCFHCLQQLPGGRARAAAAYDALLKPGGVLLMLCGSSEESQDRGPVRLSRGDVLGAFDGTRISCRRLEEFVFDPTRTYERQGHKRPPKGWLSVWVKEENLKVQPLSSGSSRKRARPAVAPKKERVPTTRAREADAKSPQTHFTGAVEIDTNGRKFVQFQLRSKHPDASYLSNMTPATIRVDGAEYPSVEHYFQSSKYALSLTDGAGQGKANRLAEQFRVGKQFGKISPKDVKSKGGKGEMSKRGVALDVVRWSAMRDVVMKKALCARVHDDQRFRVLLAFCAENQIDLYHFERSGARSHWGGFFAKTTDTWVGGNTLGAMLVDIAREQEARE